MPPTYKAAGVEYEFVQDDVSVSRQHVLRGIHGDRKTAKLVSCLHGAFYLVSSTTFRIAAIPAMDGIYAVRSQPSSRFSSRQDLATAMSY